MDRHPDRRDILLADQRHTVLHGQVTEAAYDALLRQVREPQVLGIRVHMDGTLTLEGL